MWLWYTKRRQRRDEMEAEVTPKASRSKKEERKHLIGQ